MLQIISYKIIFRIRVIENFAHKLKEVIEGLKCYNFTIGIRDLRNNPEPENG